MESIRVHRSLGSSLLLSLGSAALHVLFSGGFHWLILCLEYPPVYRTSLQKVLTKKSMVTLVTEELKQTVVIYETVEANCIKGTRCDWLNATVEWR